jgi:hypothetical protein
MIKLDDRKLQVKKQDLPRLDILATLGLIVLAIMISILKYSNILVSGDRSSEI